MFGQTFSILDIPTLFTLFFLEGALSLDNAIGVGLLVRSIAKHKRKQALFLGLLFALCFRLGAVVLASYLIESLWVRLIGGTYLVCLGSMQLFSDPSSIQKQKQKKHASFFRVLLMIEMTDLIFAIDSILAAFALIGIHPTPHHLSTKLWIVYVGGVFGVCTIRLAAHFFSSLFDRFPKLEQSAAFLVMWIGSKLVLETILSSFFALFLPSWINWIFWIGVVFAMGFGCKSRRSMN